MKILSTLARRLIVGATSAITVITLVGCVPIEGEKPKLCDTKAQHYKSERCKMVQPKTQAAKPEATKAKSQRRSNY